MHTEKQRQDKWEVETRRRMAGKLAGGLYKVWTSPSGTKFYSLKKAVEAGFTDDEGGEVDNKEVTAVKGGKGRGRKRQKKA